MHNATAAPSPRIKQKNPPPPPWEFPKINNPREWDLRTPLFVIPTKVGIQGGFFVIVWCDWIPVFGSVDSQKGDSPVSPGDARAWYRPHYCSVFMLYRLCGYFPVNGYTTYHFKFPES